MNGTHGSGHFGGTGFSGWAGSGWRDAMEQVRGFMPRSAAPRMARGDVRAAVLALLAEKPMYGYQIIHEIEERSDGAWKPSPGSVYPTLQLLADEGLVQATESDGRKTYALTDTGREAAAASDKSAPWETDQPSGKHDFSRATALPKAGVELAQAVTQVARSGNAEQVQQAIALLDETRRKLYSILAQD